MRGEDVDQDQLKIADLNLYQTKIAKCRKQITEGLS
jgi:hypothetical protein